MYIINIYKTLCESRTYRFYSADVLPPGSGTGINRYPLVDIDFKNELNYLFRQVVSWTVYRRDVTYVVYWTQMSLINNGQVVLLLGMINTEIFISKRPP